MKSVKMLKKMRPGLLMRLIAAALVAALLSGGCAASGRREDEGHEHYICFLNEDGTRIVKETYANEEETPEDMLEDMVNRILSETESEETMPLLPPDVRIQRAFIRGKVLTVDFSKEYEEMDPLREVMARAGIVRTLLQIHGVTRIRFTVDGRTAVSPTGETVGVMSADSFMEENGNQINAISHTAINLYFTNEEGNALVKEARSIYYSASKPLEWAIVERIIAGPKVEGNYATVPPTTQIISVSSAEGICYVNLSSAFIDAALQIDERIPIYSIVNSVIEDCRDITSVQISVDGDSDVVFRQETDLSKPLEADMSLLMQREP